MATASPQHKVGENLFGSNQILSFIIIFDPTQWRIQDFPEEGAPTPRGHQHTILPNFLTNCMKLKEFGPGDSP